MPTSFQSTGIDPLFLGRIFELTGLDPAELDNPFVMNRLRDIARHFSDMPDGRKHMLKILSGKSGDALDILWTYVALEKEKNKVMQELDPEEFEPDVAAEITQGHVTKEKVDRVKEDIQKRIQENRARQEEDTSAKELVTKLEGTLKTMEQIETLNKQISAYA